MQAFTDRLSRVEFRLIGVFAGLALALEFLVMSTRYLLPDLPFGWAEQLVIYLLTWALWLSASQLVERQEHIYNDLVLDRLSDRPSRGLKLIISTIGLVFCIALCWGSLKVVQFAWITGETSEGSTPIPLTWYYSSMAVGTLLMSGKYLLIVMKIWRGKA